MPQDPSCLFCKIASGEVPADVVHRDDRVVAFRDTNPQAPLHVLVIPVDHHADVASLAAADGELLAELVRVGSRVAADESDAEFRLVFNTGRSSGQTVFHVHGHVLGGRSLGWPPG
jgi:histidine triad (HIT) family protein